VDGGSDCVRVQVLTNAGAPGNPPAPERIWVLLTEANDGGWGLWGHAHTNVELFAAVRRELAETPRTSPVAEGTKNE
jgi:hypothetical protein